MIKRDCNERCHIENRLDVKGGCKAIWSKEPCRGPWRQKHAIYSMASTGVEVWNVCDAKGQCMYVYKLMRNVDESAVLREMSLQNMAAEAGLAPSIIEVTIADDEGIIIMEAMDITMSDAIESLLEDKDKDKDKVRQAIYNMALQARHLLDNLHTLGLYHGDAHSGNFMLNKAGEWQLIDFGQSGEILEGLEDYYITKDLDKLCDYLIMPRHQHKNVYSLDFIDSIKELFSHE